MNNSRMNRLRMSQRSGSRLLLVVSLLYIISIYFKRKDILPLNVGKYEQNHTDIEILEISRGVGVVVLLFHTNSAENLVPTFHQALRSWRYFLLNSIDLFIVLSTDFPLTIRQFSESLDLYNGVQSGLLHVFQLNHSTIYMKAKERVFTAPVASGSLFHCNGVRRDKGFSRFYVEGTAWYTYQLFIEHSNFLSKYKFFLKVDYDIFFFKPVYMVILQAFLEKDITFVHGGMAYHENCAKYAREISNDYLKTYKLSPKSKRIRAKNSKGKDFWINIPSSSDLYYTNFVGGLINFFGSDEVLSYAKHMFVHGNYFNFRWTDQVYFHNALGIYLKNVETGVKSLEFMRISPNSTNIPQDGSFVHAKKLEDKLLVAYNEALAKNVETR